MQAGDVAPAIAHSSGRFAAAIAAVQDADPTVPEDVTPTTDVNASVAYPDVRAASISPAGSGDLLLTFHANRNGTNGATTTFTPPSGMTEVTETSTGVAAVSNAAIEVASLALSDTSTVGAKTATASSSLGTLINQMGSTIVIRRR